MPRRPKFVDTGNPVEDTTAVLTGRERRFRDLILGGMDPETAYLTSGYKLGPDASGNYSNSPAYRKLDQAAMQNAFRAIVEANGGTMDVTSAELLRIALHSRKIMPNTFSNGTIDCGPDDPTRLKGLELIARMTGQLGPIKEQESTQTVNIYFGEPDPAPNPLATARDVTPQ